MSKNSKIIKKIARRMGAKITTAISERDLYYITYKGKSLLVEKKFFINSSPLHGARTTKCKDITYYLLKKNGIKTPKSVFFYPGSSNEKEFSNLKKIKLPLIIKQLQGSNSKDLFPFVENIEDAKKIIISELKEGKEVVAQTMVFGKEYRLLILGDRVIGALEMILPYIVGDGKMTIKQLIEKKQSQTLKKTKFDNVLRRLLTEQGYGLNSKPPKGEVVVIKRNSSLSEGGETKNVTGIVHSSFQELSKEVANNCGKVLAGIDIICENISLPLKSQKYYILEVNGMPDLTIHYTPSHGKPEDVVKKIIDYIFSKKI